MQITVNDKVTEVVEGLSLKQLIEDLSVDENGLALAVNQRVINRTLWPQHALHADDQVTLFTVVAGFTVPALPKDELRKP